MKKFTPPPYLQFAIVICFSMVIFLASCIKEPNFAPLSKEDTENLTAAPAKITPPPNCNGLIDSMPAVNSDGDSTEVATIIGAQHVNPYLIPNMQQAYANLGITNVNVTVTNLYVRFLPNSPEQFSILDSTLDAQGLELYDAPMDYDILQEGDYYQDPFSAMEDVTYQYAVVPPSFQFPAGIAYTILSQIHIPGDAYTAVETEAERLAILQDCNGNPPNGPDCGIDCHYDYSILQCVCCPPGTTWNGTECIPQCQPGYYWNGTACVPLPPPAPAADAAVPAGNITVSDINFGTLPGVRNVRIVAKRWFKIERTYTDDNGHFQFTKRFKHKVKIRVKFKNNNCNIRGIRGVRVWQTLYTIKNTLGVYSGNKSNITYNYQRFTSSSTAKGNRYWVAATTNNAIQEHRDYANQFVFSTAPLNLNIYLTNWGLSDGLASTPLFGIRLVSNLPTSFVSTYLVSPTSNPALNAMISSLLSLSGTRLDMAIGYHRNNINDFTSDFIKEIVYHESSHASQYTLAGAGWYGNFVSAELGEILVNPSGQFNPYGSGSTSNSPIIALGEAWAYHMGHFLADQRYGVTANCQFEQVGGFSYCNSTGTGHPHVDVLENFDPNLVSDPFRWIPKGLMWDLIDNTPAEIVPLTDNVLGFTNQQLFDALQSDVTSIPQYRLRLIQQNPNNQTIPVTNLFGQYHY